MIDSRVSETTESPEPTKTAAAHTAPRTLPARRIIVASILAVAAALLAPSVMPSRAFQLVFAAAVFIAVFGAPITLSFYIGLRDRIRGWRDEPVRHHKLTAAPGLVFCGALAFILLGVLFWPSWQVANYDSVRTGLGALLALLVLPPMYRAAFLLGRRLQAAPRWVRPVFLAVTLSLFLLVQLRVGYALQVLPGWDAGAVAESAFGIADGSMVAFYDYFQTYPNNLAITVGLTVYSQLLMAIGVPSSGLLFGAIALNCVVLCTAILLTYLCARHLINEGAAVFTLFPSALYIMLSPHISVVYSDSLGIVFPVLLLYLHLKAVRARTLPMKLVLWILLGAVTAVGFNLKPTAVFATAAIVGVYALEYLLRQERSLQKLRAVVAVVAATGLGFGATHTALWHEIKSQPYIGFDLDANTKAFPFTHFLMMGAAGTGSFSQEDVFATAAIEDPAERHRHGLEVYGQRVSEMGYPGYLQFLDRKAVWTFGDGSFHSWGEGLLLTKEDPFPVDDKLSNEIQDHMFGNGTHYGVTTTVWQSVWLALLFLVALPLKVRSPRLLTSNAAIMRWSLLALTLFLLFFETRPRYLYLYLPYFVLLATLTIDALSSPRSGLATGRAKEPSDQAAEISQ